MSLKKLLLKIFLLLIFLIIVIGVAYGLFFTYKMNVLGKKVTINPDGYNWMDTIKSLASKESKNNKFSEKDRINILLLGIAGKGKAGQNLTDTIMIASVNLKTNQVAFLSVPRDLLVTIPNSGVQTKINSAYQYGISLNNGDEKKAAEGVEKIISNLTSLNIDYYVILNFDGFTKVIDSVGGVNVMNERDIYDARYPGPNYSYETFELKKGFHHLDGATALKYARERHDDPDGDFGRAKRQQEIMIATKNKVFSAGTMVNVFALNDLFNALGDNIRTDISEDEIGDFIELTKKADTNNISNVVLDAWNKDSLLKVSHIFFGGIRAFVLVPRVGNYSEIQDIAQNIFDLNKIKREKDEIGKENATVAIINKSGNSSLPEKIKKLLNENLSYKNVMILSDPVKTTRDETVVYDTKEGIKPFTLNEIVKKIPASASYELPDYYTKIIENTKTEIVLVLGKDIVERYNMEEDSIEDYKNASDTNEYSEFINQ